MTRKMKDSGIERDSCFGVIHFPPGSRLRRQPGAIDIEPLRSSSVADFRHFYS